jgi:hypothetical protein
LRLRVCPAFRKCLTAEKPPIGRLSCGRACQSEEYRPMNAGARLQ